MVRNLARKYGYEFVDVAWKLYEVTGGMCPFCGEVGYAFPDYVEHLVQELHTRNIPINDFINEYKRYFEHVEKWEDFETDVRSLYDKYFYFRGYQYYVEEPETGTMHCIVSNWSPEYMDTPPVLWSIHCYVKRDTPREVINKFIEEVKASARKFGLPEPEVEVRSFNEYSLEIEITW